MATKNQQTLTGALATHEVRLVPGEKNTSLMVVDAVGQEITGVVTPTASEAAGIAVNTKQVPVAPPGVERPTPVRQRVHRARVRRDEICQTPSCIC